MKKPGHCHCGAPEQGAPSEYPNVCSQWPLCEKAEPVWAPEEGIPCDACGAEATEPCRFGCEKDLTLARQRAAFEDLRDLMDELGVDE